MIEPVQVSVGNNSLALVTLDFESKEDQVGIEVSLMLNFFGESDQPDQEDARDRLIDEAVNVIVEAMRNFAINSGIELSDEDFQKVE